MQEKMMAAYGEEKKDTNEFAKALANEMF